jgi:hypothetical protein
MDSVLSNAHQPVPGEEDATLARTVEEDARKHQKRKREKMTLTQLQRIIEQIHEKFGDLPLEVATHWDGGPVDPGCLFFLVETTNRTYEVPRIGQSLTDRPFTETKVRTIVWGNAGFRPGKNYKVLDVFGRISPFSPS